MEVQFDQSKHDALLSTAQKLSTIANLLQEGLFQGHAREALNLVLPFVAEMHAGVMKELDPLIEQLEKINEAKELETLKEIQATAQKNLDLLNGETSESAGA